MVANGGVEQGGVRSIQIHQADGEMGQGPRVYNTVRERVLCRQTGVDVDVDAAVDVPEDPEGRRDRTQARTQARPEETNRGQRRSEDEGC